jgi:acyl carrier protein
MTQDDLYAFLNELFRDVFVRDDIVLSPGFTAKDIEGWDSIKQVEIIIATEERFSIKFKTRDLDRMQCVGDLVAIIMAKVGQQSPAGRSAV